MFHVGKLAVWQVELPVRPASSPPLASVPEEICCTSLIFLKDILSDREFLVDSGASVSVFPGSNGACLLIANGLPMVCSGTCIIPLLFSCGSGSKVYTWNLQLAPVSVPLLGADFLHLFNLLLDIKCHCVVYADCESVIFRASEGPQPAFRGVAFLSAPQQVKKLLEEFPEVLFSDGFTATKPRHGVRHHLLTNPGPPVFSKPRRLDPEKLAAAQEEFSAMERAGII